MRASLNIPAPMVAYCRFHGVEPAEVAQFCLDEHSRECAELLVAGGPEEPEEERALVLN